MLDAHPAIHCGPEVKFFRDFYGDYRDDPLAHVRFFSTLSSLGLDDEERLELFGRAFVESHERAARKRGKRRWADKNPENVLYLERWMRLLAGKLCFVHVVRHPLDVLASLVEAKFDKTIPMEFERKVEVVREFLERGLGFSDHHPELSFTLRYEDLVTETDALMRRLLDWLGESFDARMLTDYRSPERQSGIEDPKTATRERISAENVGRWRRDLSADDARYASSQLASLLDLLGYERCDAEAAR